MALSRCTETRLVEAVYREAVACFTQSAFESAYNAPNGSPRIYAHTFSIDEQLTLSPWTIIITPQPPEWRPGVGGTSNDFFIIEVAFVFPHNALAFEVGSNTYLDHIETFRLWLISGGTWATRNTGAIEDPDNAGHEIAHLTAFSQADDALAPNKAGIVVPVLLEYHTRTEGGNVV